MIASIVMWMACVTVDRLTPWVFSMSCIFDPDKCFKNILNLDRESTADSLLRQHVFLAYFDCVVIRCLIFSCILSNNSTEIRWCLLKSIGPSERAQEDQRMRRRFEWKGNCVSLGRFRGGINVVKLIRNSCILHKHKNVTKINYKMRNCSIFLKKF